MSIKANLSQAAFNHETILIGGGQFHAKELYEHYQAMEAALEAARLLCINLSNGGQGHMALVKNFQEKDDMVK